MAKVLAALLQSTAGQIENLVRMRSSLACRNHTLWRASAYRIDCRVPSNFWAFLDKRPEALGIDLR